MLPIVSLVVDWQASKTIADKLPAAPAHPKWRISASGNGRLRDQPWIQAKLEEAAISELYWDSILSVQFTRSIYSLLSGMLSVKISKFER